MNTAKAKAKLVRLTCAMLTGIFFLALFMLACSAALPAAAAGTATVTEVHNYPGAVDTQAARSVPAGTSNLLDWQQPTYAGAEYELESISVEKKAPVYSVTFNANGGVPTPPTQTVEHGEKVIDPNEPERNGHAFAGWYQAAGLSGPAWNFDNDAVTGDMTLYAKWTPVTVYVVVFVANGGTPVPPFQSVVSGQKIIEPGDPTRNSYEFGGWYLAWDWSGPAWDFDNDIITGNTILYASWIPILRSPAEPATSPVSLSQPVSPFNSTTVWTNSQPDSDADYTFEEDHIYQVAYHYKVAAPTVYTVSERYQNQYGNSISAATSTQVDVDNSYSKTAPVFAGYTFTGATLNGVPQSGYTVAIASVSSDYTVVFAYTPTDIGGVESGDGGSGGGSGGGTGSPGSNYTIIGDQLIPQTQLPGELETIPEGEVPLAPAPQTGIRPSGAGISGAILLLLCSLAAIRPTKKK